MGSERLNRQKNARWFMKIHRHLIRPPFPVLIGCPNCMHPLIEVNANSIEMENTIGFQDKELLAKNVWMRLKHSCGAKIVFYWSE